jgi:small conductance mechanosensitive channel
MDWLKDIFGISYTEFNQLLLRFGSRLLIAALIIVIGFWIAGLLTKALRKMLNKSDIDTGLVTFLTSFFSMAFKILVLVTAIMELGIQMTSIIALLGAAGLAIGMAFSGTLSNFAGGIMILVLKPFKVGDFVDAQGVQ